MDVPPYMSSFLLQPRFMNLAFDPCRFFTRMLRYTDHGSFYFVTPVSAVGYGNRGCERLDCYEPFKQYWFALHLIGISTKPLSIHLAFATNIRLLVLFGQTRSQHRHYVAFHAGSCWTIWLQRPVDVMARSKHQAEVQEDAQSCRDTPRKPPQP